MTVRIFLSHSYQDSVWCDELVATLTTRYDVDIWYDRQNLSAGAQWVRTIEDELSARDDVLVVLTPESWASEWVRQEIALALAAQKRIVGIQHKATAISGFLLQRQMINVMGQAAQAAASVIARELRLPVKLPRPDHTAQIIQEVSGIACVAWSPDSSRVVLGNSDRTARIWDALHQKPVLTLSPHDNAYIDCVAWSPDGSRIVTGCRYDAGYIWDAHTGALLHTINKRGMTGVVRAAWSPDSQFILTADRYKRHIWNARTGQRVQSFANDAVDESPAVDWFPRGANGNRIMANRRVIDVATGGVMQRFNVGVEDLAIAPEGSRVLVMPMSDAVILNVQTGGIICTLTYADAGPLFGDWAPDGRRVVTSHRDGSAIVWDAASGAVQTQFAGHDHGETCVAWSPDGSRIITGNSGDKTARIWTVPLAGS